MNFKYQKNISNYGRQEKMSMLYSKTDNRVSVLPCNPNGASPFFVYRPFTHNWFDLVNAKQVLVYDCCLASKKPIRTLVPVWRRVDRSSAKSSTKRTRVFDLVKAQLTRLSSYLLPRSIQSLSSQSLGGQYV